MRYLKSYNESVESTMGDLLERIIKTMDELNELCEQHLVYLKDEGFIYTIDMNEDNQGDLILTLQRNKEEFSWDEIKDRFIPFLIMLQRNFKPLSNVEFILGTKYMFTTTNENFKIEHLINDTLSFTSFKAIDNIIEIIIKIDVELIKEYNSKQE